MKILPQSFAKPGQNGSPKLLSRRGWFRFGIAFLLLGALAFGAAQVTDASSWWVHGSWCAVGLIIALPVLGRIFRTGFMVVLQDHRVMFTTAFALYFLFGASLLAFGSERDIADVLRYYPANATDAMQINAINAIGFGLALITSALCNGHWLGNQTARIATVASRTPAPWVMLGLMAAGALASAHVLIYDFAFKDGIVAGSWRAASQFVLVAIMLGSSYRGRREAAFRLAALCLSALIALSGILLFNKTAMLLPVGALIAGLSVRYGVRVVLPVGAVLMILLFASVGGAVAYGRSTINTEIPHSLETRWLVFKEGLVASKDGEDVAQYNTWGRLCYVAPQVAAYDFYNSGRGGDDFRLIPWLFVPRALAPSKPNITVSGVDFNEKISGHRFSSTGQGIFSSGYYNAGWLGVLLAAALCGWILAQTSAIAVAIFSHNAFLLLPFALSGVYMAFRIDGTFVADYLGSFVFTLYPILFLSGLIALNRRRS